MTTTENTWPNIIEKSRQHAELNATNIEWAMGEAMSGNADPVHIAGLLAALNPDMITSAELAHFGEQMLAHASSIKNYPEAVDIVGTGGDQLNTVNISTMAALVVAGAGIQIAKHGNRASSSSTGSADVIEALGVDLNLDIPQVEDSIDTLGIGFLFAQTFHPSMRFIAPVRKKLGIPTVFNYLGPLTNPTQPLHSVIGVANANMLEVLAQAFAQREGGKTLVVRGHLGLDEISISGPTQVFKATGGQIEAGELNPKLFGMDIADISEIRGGYAQENAQVVLDFLHGKKGAVRDAVLLNAAAGIYVQRYFERDLLDGMQSGLADAIESVASGAALQKLEDWKKFTSKFRLR